jgi:hypothetical protein
VHFKLNDPQDPDFVPSRLPLVVTLALRQAKAGSLPASDVWADVHKALNFLIGPTDDAGPLEYATLMDQVYTNHPTLSDLADNAKWTDFLRLSDQLPAPRINSTFLDFSAELETDTGWRFMGQRFTLDGYIFQNLIFDQVKPRPSGEKRMFPSGLDVMAVFGSASALKTLTDLGETTYPNYPEQMAKLQAAVQAQPEAQWLARFYDSWLYSFFPLLATKDNAFPAYMRTTAWGFKDLNSTLGSWAELKHDTILYTKMPEFLGGGGPPSSGAAPAYVEANPDAFFRMAFMAQSILEGFQYREFSLILGNNPQVEWFLDGMGQLAEKYQKFGDMAAKELAGTPLTSDDYEVIQDCLGPVECKNRVTPYNVPASEMPPAPIVAAVSGAEDQVLEVGIGNIDRIYVVVPLDGMLQVAQGGVFSYYEFLQPRDNRLTDQEWRSQLADTSLPVWAGNFVLNGGTSTHWLAFRVGDVYLITAAGDKLNVRKSASVNAQVLGQFHTGDYVEITGGPVLSGGYTWWQVDCASCSGSSPLSGWVVENQEWFERAHGQ